MTDKKSKHKNVYWSSGRNKWRVAIQVSGKSHYLGYFLNETEANEAAVKFKIENLILDEQGKKPGLLDSFIFSNGKLYSKYNTQMLSVGDEVGTLSKIHGYIKIRHGNKVYPAHRIIWQMLRGSLDDSMQIDHINGIKHDNRIENLRVATYFVNAKNRRIPSNNTTGYVGIKKTKLGAYHARIGYLNKLIHLGTFKDFDSAYIARKEAEATYGFHQNHGRAA